MEEATELVSPRISFSHDLVATPPPAAALAGRRSTDASSPLVPCPRLPEPEFDFANAAVADVAPADRLFAGGKLLPVPPLPPAPKPSSPCKQQACTTTTSRVKAQQAAACQQRRPGPWASPFSRSSSASSAATATAGVRFGCPPFPLMRSWSVGSAVARNDALRVAVSDSDAAGLGHRPHHQCYNKFGGAAAAAGDGGGSRAYYCGGGSRKSGGSSSSSHGVRVRPVLSVPFIGTSVSNVLSYLLCDCTAHRAKKSRDF